MLYCFETDLVLSLAQMDILLKMYLNLLMLTLTLTLNPNPNAKAENRFRKNKMISFFGQVSRYPLRLHTRYLLILLIFLNKSHQTLYFFYYINMIWTRIYQYSRQHLKKLKKLVVQQQENSKKLLCNNNAYYAPNLKLHT